MDWQPIATAPRDGTHILIRYYKKGKGWRTRVSREWIVTEAFYVPPRFYDWDKEKKHPVSGKWLDALQRLICDEGAAKSSSIVAYWMPMPPEPKETACTSA